MVPLDAVTKRSAEAEPLFVPKKPDRRPEPQQPARGPRRFKVVDVMTREVLTDEASTREAIEVLKDVRSIVDVSIYVWHEEQDRWRLLTLADQRGMWELARRPRLD